MRIFKTENYIKNDIISSSFKEIKSSGSYHGHEFWEIEFIVEGTGSYEIDGVIYPIKKNTLFITNPSNIHSIRCADAKLINVMFLRESNENLFDCYFLLKKEPVMTFDDETGNFVSTLLFEIAKTSETAPDYAMHLLDCIFFKIYQNSLDKKEQNLSYTSSAIAYIYTHFSQNLSLQRVAHNVGLSEAYFSALFKKETGVNFKEYLDEIRFSYAKKLLRYTAFEIKEIHALSGFSDYANFSRRFKKKYGMTPTEFRKSKNKI